MGLEKCGDTCVAQCCNEEASIACPVNSYCTSNGEFEFCCERGHTCDEPLECLSLDNPKCVDNAGELVEDEGKEKGCCYTGFEVCTTIWEGFPACMPTGIVEVPDKPPRHTHTGSFDPEFHRTSIRMTAEPTPTITEPPISVSGDEGRSNDTNEVGRLEESVDDDEQGNEDEEDEFNDSDKDGVDDDDDPNHSFPIYTGVGAIVGGVVGGVLGLSIIGATVFFTGRHYRRKLKEAQAMEQLPDGPVHIRGGGNSGSGMASPSNSSHSWSKWVASPELTPSTPSPWRQSDVGEKNPDVVTLGGISSDQSEKRKGKIREPEPSLAVNRGEGRNSVSIVAPEGDRRPVVREGPRAQDSISSDVHLECSPPSPLIPPKSPILGPNMASMSGAL
ncbi:hypothetical protein BDZ91DRAFT_753902 [Kalaharituber pfeilii]|nr:hypothetical protein BDZ91DRAFT_753902 [Kalaharituber pfeilii]